MSLLDNEISAGVYCFEIPASGNASSFKYSNWFSFNVIKECRMIGSLCSTRFSVNPQVMSVKAVKSHGLPLLP